MSIGDSMKKLIGIEEIEEDEEVTEEELNEAKAQLTRQNPVRPAADIPPARPTVAQAPAPEHRAAPAPMAAATAPRRERRFTVTNGNAFKLILLEPKTFDECPSLVDSLKEKKPVIINLEKLDIETGRKIFDFLSGATYALNGNVQRVANNIFIFAPENVDIAGEISEDEEEAPKAPGFPGDSRATMQADSPWR